MRPSPAGRPAPGALRTAVERRSAGLLVALSTRPRWLLPLACTALLGGLLFLPAVPAVACLVPLLAVVGWLAYLSWPTTDTGGRIVRVLALALLLALGVRAVTG